MQEDIIGIIADLHFRGFRLKDIATAWELAVQDMIDNKVTVCLIVGDVFDTSNISSKEASLGTIYRAFVGPVKRLMRTGCEVIIMSGNHDCATGNQYSALETLKDIEIEGTHPIRIVEDIQVLCFHDVLRIALIPWLRGAEESVKTFLKYLGNLTIKKKLILVGHCDVAGAKSNQGYSLIGGSFELTTEELETSGADLIALGHFHNRQGYYVGSLTQLNFGEAGNPTGYLLCKFVGDELYKEFREIESAKYVTIDVQEDALPDLENLIVPENYYRIRFYREYTPDEVKSFVGKANIKIERILGRTITSRTGEELTAQDNPIELMKVYIKLHPELKDLEDDLIKAAKKLLEGEK